jgi:hypothetical protein
VASSGMQQQGVARGIAVITCRADAHEWQGCGIGMGNRGTQQGYGTGGVEQERACGNCTWPADPEGFVCRAGGGVRAPRAALLLPVESRRVTHRRISNTCGPPQALLILRCLRRHDSGRGCSAAPRARELWPHLDKQKNHSGLNALAESVRPPSRDPALLPDLRGGTGFDEAVMAQVILSPAPSSHALPCGEWGLGSKAVRRDRPSPDDARTQVARRLALWVFAARRPTDVRTPCARRRALSGCGAEARTPRRRSLRSSRCACPS